jgi:hypothetical protein
MILNREIAGRPATSPPLHLPSGKANFLGRLVVSQTRLRIEEQGEPETLDSLNRQGSAADSLPSGLQEIVRESTTGRGVVLA